MILVIFTDWSNNQHKLIEIDSRKLSKEDYKKLQLCHNNTLTDEGMLAIDIDTAEIKDDNLEIESSLKTGSKEIVDAIDWLIENYIDLIDDKSTIYDDEREETILLNRDRGYQYSEIIITGIV